jgi:DNA-binding transcriptional ArsR family regulator
MKSNAESRRPASDARLDAVFAALSDRTRRTMLARLAGGPANVTELAKPFNMTLQAVGKHVRVLERAGLIRREIDGRIHHCSLNPLPLRDAEAWLERYRRFWDETLEALSGHFERRS